MFSLYVLRGNCQSNKKHFDSTINITIKTSITDTTHFDSQEGFGQSYPYQVHHEWAPRLQGFLKCEKLISEVP